MNWQTILNNNQTTLNNNVKFLIFDVLINNFLKLSKIHANVQRFSRFLQKNFFFEINTFNELSNILENDAIFIFNSNFDFFDILKIVNNETQRIFDRHSKFSFKQVFFVDFLIDLIVLFKISFVNSYEFKIYKQTIINIYHKMK